MSAARKAWEQGCSDGQIMPVLVALREAADEIERLRGENVALREALLFLLGRYGIPAAALTDEQQAILGEAEAEE